MFFNLQAFDTYSDDKNVEFLITLSKENMAIALQEGLEKKFKLTTTIGTTNMHLFDSNGKIRKYDTPEDSKYNYTNYVVVLHFSVSHWNYVFPVLKEFFGLRLEFYEKRKVHIFIVCSFSILF